MTTTRFAPSPTGYIHVGNLRTALFNYMIAAKNGGTFIFVSTTPTPVRSEEKYVDAIKQDLEWLGLSWDKVERQSARMDRYAETADKLREMGRFYEAFETPTELDLKRKKQLNMGKPPVYDRSALALSDAEKDAMRAERGNGVWRYKLDHERIEWADGIVGDISIDAASVSDPVLIRGDGQVLYTLASIVDDTDMGVTNVVRGSDHVTNTATQIQMIRAIGGTVPDFAHHSLLTGPQGESLSKRLGTLALRDLREAGVQPMALLSLLARLGSSQPVEVRSSLDELIDGFDISQFGSAPTKFDADDLYPLTARYNHTLPLSAVQDRITALGVPADQAERFWDVARENITVLSDLSEWSDLAQNGADPIIEAGDEDFIAQAMKMLPDGPYTDTTWGEWTTAVKEATGRKGKGLFMPLRKAVTGRERGPDMASLMPLLQVIKAKG